MGCIKWQKITKYKINRTIARMVMNDISHKALMGTIVKWRTHSLSKGWPQLDAGTQA